MITQSNDTKMGKASRKSLFLSIARALLVDLPFTLLISTLCGSLLIQRVYLTYVVPIAQSYKRGEMIGNFYELYDNDFTYYNRHCGPDDLTTRSANDLLIHEEYSSVEAADVMLEHGAVAFQNVLRNDTATTLRAYLAQKHHNKENLAYNEVMWDEISRLSLGIGTSDHPVISQAMKEVGSHPVIKRTLEGILGKDPAIVEISTLTSLNGATDQGIHTDSDWFGSSLLYSRNFLHSYSMFISLQDTSKDMGATTVCPGSHYCADPDLEELCLEHGAFEMSTNGHTGEDGVLRKGDAFLFNQNVWHRGPANVDPDGTDRFMFIMTFASAKDVAADRRRQGLGTYYYQRFNMWGSTFSMLKDATTKMVQPFSALRALGLVKTRGITWIHQFCQQFANGDEFYNDDELDDLYEKVLTYYNVPSFLLSKSERWEEFIPEGMSLFIDLAVFANAVAITLYCILCTLIRAIGGSGRAGGAWVQCRLFLIAATIGLAFHGMSTFFDQTELARSVTTGDVFVKPFPTPSEVAVMKPAGPTTFPERHDVLISTRFDSDFLASFNRFLSFHPGNHRWESMVSFAASVPNNLQQLAVQSIVQDALSYKEAGLPTRFLLQDPYTGSWTIMTDEEALKVTERAVTGTRNPLIGALATKAKYLLADSRFGEHRGTGMAALSEQLLTRQWLPLLYGEEIDLPDPAVRAIRKNAAGPRPAIPPVTSRVSVKETTQRDLVGWHRRSAIPSIESSAPDGEISIGDKVWVYYDRGQWYEARVADFLDDEETAVLYVYGGGYFEEVHVEDIRPYLSVKSGDEVVVDYYANLQEYYPGTIAKVHPDGRCSIVYDDGEVQNKVNREQLLHVRPENAEEE